MATNANDPINVTPDGHLGLTKREYFAGLILQGVIANSNIQNRLSALDREWIDFSITKADDLIEALNK